MVATSLDASRHTAEARCPRQRTRQDRNADEAGSSAVWVTVPETVAVSVPSPTGHEESDTAAVIGTADDGSTRTGGPDESVVADAVSGR